MHQLFPNGAGMVERPAKLQAASAMEMRPMARMPDVTEQGPITHGKRFAHAERAHQKIRSMSTKGDASLMHGGVARVDLPNRCESAEMVTGFAGIGQLCKPNAAITGKAHVPALTWDPFTNPWDPLHLKKRAHPSPSAGGLGSPALQETPQQRRYPARLPKM
jgi:hypothetical protein